MSYFLRLSSVIVFLLIEGKAAIIATFRGDEQNILEPNLPIPSQGELDLNGDGAFELFFFSDGNLAAGMRSSETTRFISTLSTPPNVGGRVSPVEKASILGEDTTAFGGDWHFHTENGGSNGFSLAELQFEDAYIGVEFSIDGNTHYGWLHYTGFGHPERGSLSPNIPGGFINSWAYESEPEKAIMAGVIPEPSTLFLAGLAMSLLIRRKR